MRCDLERATAALNPCQIRTHPVDISMQTQSLLDQEVAIEANIQKLRLQQADMQRQVTPEHPAYKALIQQIGQLEGQKAGIDKRVNNLPPAAAEAYARHAGEQRHPYRPAQPGPAAGHCPGGHGRQYAHYPSLGTILAFPAPSIEPPALPRMLKTMENDENKPRMWGEKLQRVLAYLLSGAERNRRLADVPAERAALTPRASTPDRTDRRPGDATRPAGLLPSSHSWLLTGSRTPACTIHAQSTLA